MSQFSSYNFQKTLYFLLAKTQITFDAPKEKNKKIFSKIHMISKRKIKRHLTKYMREKAKRENFYNQKNIKGIKKDISNSNSNIRHRFKKKNTNEK